MHRVKNIGLVLETKEDALKTNLDLDWLLHWREEGEIEAIRQAIEKLGFHTLILGTPEHFCQNLDSLKNKVDFIFNLSVGFMSRFRQAKACMLYELTQIPYSGADPYSRLVCQNKQLLKSFLDKLNIPSPSWVYIDNMSTIENTLFPSFPLIVKPSCEGTSVGIYKESLVQNNKDLKDRIQFILEELRMSVVVEQFISGREFKVCFIGNEEIRFKGIMEDVLEDGSSLKDNFLFIHAKKEMTFSKKRMDVDDALFTGLMKDANRIYQHFLPLDYGVFDLRMDAGSNPYFIEFNADASLHPDRSLAQCCKLNNIPFDAMIEMILCNSLERWGIA